MHNNTIKYYEVSVITLIIDRYYSRRYVQFIVCYSWQLVTFTLRFTLS